MSRKTKIVLTYAALIPLLLKLPLLFQIWRASPLDRFDGLFWLFALLLTLVILKKIRHWAGDSSRWGWGILAAGIVILTMAQLKSITAAYLAGAMIFAAGSIYALWGMRAFVGTLPIWGILLLGCPSSNFWAGYWLQTVTDSPVFSGLVFKIPAAAVLALYLLLVHEPPRLKQLIFPALLSMLLLLVMVQQRRPLYGVPIRLATDRIQYGDWLGQNETLTDQEKRFFGDSKAHRLTYFNQNSHVFLLMIKLGHNVHNIHPTELCLKTARSHIVGSRERLVGTINGPLAVQELIVERNGARYVVYTWYSGKKWSSGSFLMFRRAWRPNDDWYSYQIQTPARPHVKEAQRRLRLFIDSMLIQ